MSALCSAPYCGAQENTLANYELGFSLNGTCFVYTVVDDSVIDSDPIGNKAFIMQASGAETSRADPGGEDLYKKNAVGECGTVLTAHQGSTSTCAPRWTTCGSS